MDNKPLWLLAAALVQMNISPAFGAEHTTHSPLLDYVLSSAFPDNLEPEGDTIYRLDIDPNGNGKPIILLSYANFTNRSGNIWTAYMPAKDGYNRIDHTDNGRLIQFREFFYYVGKFPSLADKGALLILDPGKGGANMARYTFHNGGAHVDELPSVDYGNPTHIKKFKGIFKRLDPDMPIDAGPPPSQNLSAAEIKASIHPQPPPEEASQSTPVEPTAPPAITQVQEPSPPAVSSTAAPVPIAVKETSSLHSLFLVGFSAIALVLVCALALKRRTGERGERGQL